MALTDRISDGFTSVGQEVKAVRAEKANVTHAHGGADITSGTVAYARLPVGTAESTVAAGDDARLSDARTPIAHTHPTTAITAAPRTVTYANLSTLAPASGVATDVVTCTLTGNPTITPAAGSDGQIIRLRLLAGASARTVTIASAVRLGTGITARTLNITANQAGVIGLEYISGLSAWVLFSAYATTS